MKNEITTVQLSNGHSTGGKWYLHNRNANTASFISAFNDYL